MFRLFFMMPVIICLYEIVSLILPLKISLWIKLLMSLILFAGLGKFFAYRMTPSGFEIYEIPHFVTLILSGIFSFIICALFMLLLKDAIFILWKIFIRAKFPGHYASLTILIIASLSTLYGVYQGVRVPDVITHEVKIPGLGKDLDGLKVAMIVDIHTSMLNRREFVSSVVEKVNSLEPDVILIPGDFVDGSVKARYTDLEPISQLKAKYGVFGVTGNHEYYFDLQGWLKTIKDFGVRLLENEHVEISSGDAKLIIAGVPDPTGGNHNTQLALEGVDENLPVILMDHQPRFARENSEHNIALQVSGHTHGGQMPIVRYLIQRANNGFVRGWYDVNNMKLYVSPGTSQWDGFIIRLFDNSEISLFILKP
ncbi:MAG: metallophosphoesterase [Synergistaceae bacterium]|nr:metallophosphoesterase [Synergistaceae bacterium]